MTWIVGLGVLMIVVIGVARVASGMAGRHEGSDGLPPPVGAEGEQLQPDPVEALRLAGTLDDAADRIEGPN